MAAPQRRPRYRTPVARPARKRSGRQGVPGGTPKRAWQGERRPKRAFVVLVVVPVLLMMGSVYVHTVAAGLKGEAARLEEEKARAEGEGKQLEVWLTELSEPGRIRALAREYLGMQDPSGKNLETYDDGSDGEDVANGGGEKNKETGE